MDEAPSKLMERHTRCSRGRLRCALLSISEGHVFDEAITDWDRPSLAVPARSTDVNLTSLSVVLIDAPECTDHFLRTDGHISPGASFNSRLIMLGNETAEEV